MSLFVDGPTAGIDQLREYESSILDVAATEGIDLSVKLALAHREIGTELELFLADREAGLENVVVTPVLEAWHACQTLALTFADAHQRQLNDRYDAKRKDYEQRTKIAAAALFDLGVGITREPLPRLEKPEVTVGPGALPAATYFISAAWVGAQGQESSPSEPVAIVAPEASSVTARVSNAPQGARGWNVYAGYAVNDLTLQNDAPLAASAGWSVPAAGLRHGRIGGTGQAPDSYLKRIRILQRG